MCFYKSKNEYFAIFMIQKSKYDKTYHTYWILSQNEVFFQFMILNF